MTAFSIVTVVYNCNMDIEKTMNSVTGQDYKNIEYIIIDGDSFDGTKERIHNYISSCAIITQEIIREESFYLEATHKIFPAFTFKFLSEKDDGIYDAMNKGIALSTKQWVNFMNCGDVFYNTNILNIIAKQDPERSDVIYGNTEIVAQGHKIKTSIAKEKNHRFHHQFIHQSSFVLSHLLKKYKYDTSFKIAGDTDFFTKLYNNGYTFKKINTTISIFNQNGISSRLSWLMFYEECRIGYKYNKLFPLYLALKWSLWTVPKSKIKKLFKK